MYWKPAYPQLFFPVQKLHFVFCDVIKESSDVVKTIEYGFFWHVVVYFRVAESAIFVNILSQHTCEACGQPLP